MKSNAIDYLGDELDRVVDYCRREYDMRYSDVVGVLMFKIHLMCNEAIEEHDGTQDETSKS